jgi:predicted dehydrogenase
MRSAFVALGRIFNALARVGRKQPKRQRTVALQDLAEGVACNPSRQRLGVRLSSAAFPSIRWGCHGLLQKRKLVPPALVLILVSSLAMNALTLGAGQVQIITLDPGHFHASLVQKSMYPGVNPVVNVFAPAGEDLNGHLKRINDFNSRPENPTHWDEKVYSGPDFLERMIRDKPGNLVVIAGNNTRKTDYINRSLEAGFNVLADKPMAINPEQFQLLCKAFDRAAQKRLLLYDIMTSRFEITAILQRELAGIPDVFGTLQPGTPERPGVAMESVHHFFKEVAGKALIRPAWFFDVRQEGEAISDVGSHLIDLVQWECFPGQSLDWRKDIKVLSARRWPTSLTPAQFKRATGLDQYPDFLKKDVATDGSLNVFANGEVRYRIRGVHASVTARWSFEAPPGVQDTQHSLLSGSRANLIIRQGREQNYQSTLYVEKNFSGHEAKYEASLRTAVAKLAKKWPGLELKSCGDSSNSWQVVIPEKYNVGHEAHFAQVTKNFLQYLADGKMPEWEVPNMLCKYYTTTEAYRLSHEHYRTP